MKKRLKGYWRTFKHNIECKNGYKKKILLGTLIWIAFWFSLLVIIW